MFKLALEKTEEPEIKLPHALYYRKREFQKNIYFCFTDYAKALTVWITTNHVKFLKRWEHQNTLPASILGGPTWHASEFHCVRRGSDPSDQIV